MDEIKNYALSLNSSSEIMDWISGPGKKAIAQKAASAGEIEHIIDWFNSIDAPKRLRKMSIKDALRLSKDWTERQKKKGRNLIDKEGDIEIVHDFLDGTTIVKLLSKKAYQREGFMMNHCAGGYDHNNTDCIIYSYRDAKNDPHATFEIRKECNEIVQIKGKGNGEIHPKYIHPILTFLKTVGMNVRPSDMKNLGYYHVDKSIIPYLKSIGRDGEICMIHGEAYAY